jgi:hypothetical protein
MSSEPTYCWATSFEWVDVYLHVEIYTWSNLTVGEARIIALAKRPKGVQCVITLEAVSCVPSFQVGWMT